MRYICREDLLDECNKYAEAYPAYGEEEKVSYDGRISNLLTKAMNVADFRDYETVCDFHNLCLKLDSAMGLACLDFKMLDNWYYDREIRTVLEADAKSNLSELVRKKLRPYVTNCLSHQLNIGQRLFMQHSDLGSDVLSKNSHYVFTDLIHMIMWLKSSLNKLGIETGILSDAVSCFTAEEIAFVYAQLAAYDRCDSSFDEDAREELYNVMHTRSDSDKKEFIRTICLLGYCNFSEGISAMIMDMYDTCGSEGICRMMYEFMRGNGEWKYGISDDYFSIALPQIRGAYLLRKQDDANGQGRRTVKRYMNDSFNDMVKNRGFYS